MGTLTKIRHLTEWTKVDVPAIIDEKTFGRVAQRSAWQRAGANGRTGSSERVRVARKRIAAHFEFGMNPIEGDVNSTRFVTID